MYAVGQVLFTKPRKIWKSSKHEIEDMKTAVDSEGNEYTFYQLSSYGVWWQEADLVNGFLLEKIEQETELETTEEGK